MCTSKSPGGSLSAQSAWLQEPALPCHQKAALCPGTSGAAPMASLAPAFFSVQSGAGGRGKDTAIQLRPCPSAGRWREQRRAPGEGAAAPQGELRELPQVGGRADGRGGLARARPTSRTCLTCGVPQEAGAQEDAERLAAGRGGPREHHRQRQHRHRGLLVRRDRRGAARTPRTCSGLHAVADLATANELDSPP